MRDVGEMQLSATVLSQEDLYLPISPLSPYISRADLGGVDVLVVVAHLGRYRGDIGEM